MLGGGGFQADGIHAHVHKGGEGLLHGFDVRAQLGMLGADGGIHVADAVAVGVQQIGGAAKKYLGVYAAIFLCRVGKLVAYVAEIGGPEEGVAEGMDEHVGIAVAKEPVGVGNTYAAQPKFAALYETMYVVTETDAHNESLTLLEILSSRGRVKK